MTISCYVSRCKSTRSRNLARKIAAFILTFAVFFYAWGGPGWTCRMAQAGAVTQEVRPAAPPAQHGCCQPIASHETSTPIKKGCCQTKGCCEVKSSPSARAVVFGLNAPPEVEQPGPVNLSGETTIPTVDNSQSVSRKIIPIFSSPPLYQLTSVFLI